MTVLMHTLHVDLGERSYPIYIGRELLGDATLLARHISGKQVALVSNETVAPLYAERVRSALPGGTRCTEIVLPDGEQYKNLECLNAIFDRLLEDGHNRSTTLVAVGGGVVGETPDFWDNNYYDDIYFRNGEPEQVEGYCTDVWFREAIDWVRAK